MTVGGKLLRLFAPGTVAALEALAVTNATVVECVELLRQTGIALEALSERLDEVERRVGLL